MFSVLMGTLRKVPILLDISYSQLNVVQVGVSIKKIREELVNYISMTEQPGVLIKMIRKIAVLLCSLQRLIKLYKNDMPFWGASQGVLWCLQPEIVGSSEKCVKCKLDQERKILFSCLRLDFETIYVKLVKDCALASYTCFVMRRAPFNTVMLRDTYIYLDLVYRE